MEASTRLEAAHLGDAIADLQARLGVDVEAVASDGRHAGRARRAAADRAVIALQAQAGRDLEARGAQHHAGVRRRAQRRHAPLVARQLVHWQLAEQPDVALARRQRERTRALERAVRDAAVEADAQ